MAAQYSLENINFTANLSSSLASLLSGSQLCDVTLVCDDGQLSAHKVILAASSTFFSSVFLMYPHNHPLLYLRGVKTEQMQFLLQFLYAGATDMKKEEVPSFLSMASDLKIVGLMGSLDEHQMVTDQENGAETTHIEENENKAVILQEPRQEQKYDENQLESNPTVSAILENRPNITMMSNTTAPKASDSQQKKPILHQKVNHEKPLVERKILTSVPRSHRPLPAPSIFCPVCQTTDRRNSTIKMHMEAKRQVQCKACKLFFGNCFSLGKHMKGRCRDKKAREENEAKYNSL